MIGISTTHRRKSRMQFFNKFFNLQNMDTMDSGEYAVCCPFDHHDQYGNAYKEHNASAHINPEKGVFHCKVCDVGLSEPNFLAKIEGIRYKDALIMLREIEESPQDDWATREQNILGSKPKMEFVQELGLEPVREKLRIGYSGAGIDFPVFVYGELLDVRTYNPDAKPKVRSRKGAKTLIIPFDLWREDDSPTLLCAGEKDMAIARANGFNAINFTGGEMAFPKLFKHSFKGREVYICYDNDATGLDGARKVAFMLKDAGATPYIVTGHHLVCTEKGGDIHDFFKKYGKTKEDLQDILINTQPATDLELKEAKNSHIPLIPIEQSSRGQYVNNRFVRSNVNTVSIYEDMFTIPDVVRFEKYDCDNDKDEMQKGDIREWVLDDDNVEDILELMDSKIDRNKRNKALRRFARVPDEDYIRMDILSQTNVFKAVVTDVMDTTTDAFKATELTMYSVEQRMLAGKKYEMLFKPVAHPFEGQRVVGITIDLKESDADIQSFKVDDGVQESLKVFQVQEDETINDKMEEFFERSKGFVGVEARKEVSWATDLFYHTPLEFKIGKRVERAYLDAMIIGDPRTMKSATAKAMREMYELGTVTSLKTATIAGLLGGSDKVNGGGYKTKIGLIPQSHKGAIIMEEFSGGGRDMVSQLTEVRSSNRVRITRVNGTTDVPAMVRMLSISNPSTKDGISYGLRQYPSGIKVIMDLIGASEDIARYDFFLLVDEPEHYTSPLDMFDREQFEKQSYMNRIRWIWSRTAEQVEITREIAQYLVTCAEALNKRYDCHIKLFGAEAWKKILRVAIACAGLTVSTDSEFERIVVKREHIEWACNFLKDIYDNPLFKLKEYVENERSYNRCEQQDIIALQNEFGYHGSALLQMEISTELTQKQLQLVSGLDNKDFAKFVSRLGGSRFIQWQGEKIVPTGKFRQCMKKISRDTYMKKASEE